MKIHATGATDGGNIILFWPNHMPEDADKQIADGSWDFLFELAEAGKLLWFPCGGDADCSVSIFVDLKIPPELLALCHDREDYPRIIVDGDGYFGGVEYAFKKNRSLVDKHPGMVSLVKIPRGEYRVELYTVRDSQALRKDWVCRNAGLIPQLIDALMFAALFGVVIGLLATCILCAYPMARFVTFAAAVALG